MKNKAQFILKIKNIVLNLAVKLPLGLKMLLRHSPILRFESMNARLDYIKKVVDINDKAIVFDLGANIGNFGNLLRKSYNDLYLIGYEANQSLECCFQYKQLYNKLHFKAVTKDGRKVVLNVDGNSDFNISSASSIVVKPKKMTGQVQIESVSLTDVFLKENVNKYNKIIIKIDIEGSEFEILKEDFWSILEGKDILVLVEEHPFLFFGREKREYKSRIRRFRKYIESNGGTYIQWV
jgi:FkbM family methyltransferase